MRETREAQYVPAHCRVQESQECLLLDLLTLTSMDNSILLPISCLVTTKCNRTVYLIPASISVSALLPYFAEGEQD